MNPLGYLMFAILALTTIVSLMVAAGTRRTHDEDLAWQRQRDLVVMTRIAHRADQLAADGHYLPGTAALTEYQDRQQKAEQNR